MNENEQVKSKKKYIIQFILIGIFIALCVAATIYLYPIIQRINTDEAYQKEFMETIDSFGIWGVVIIIFCFVIQNILAVIPTAPFEIVSGMLYGTWGGVLIALIGSTIGALIVILLVRLFGENFAKKFVNIEDRKKFKFVDDPMRTGLIMFCILFVPGIPKDFVCFLVPFTKIKTWQFLIINFVARTPSTIIAALLGHSLLTGEFGLTLVLFIIAVIISLLGIIFNKQIVNFINRFSQTKKEA